MVCIRNHDAICAIISDMVEIRPFTPQDFPYVIDVLKDAGLYDEDWDKEETFVGIIEKDKEGVLLAVEGTEIIGNVVIMPFGPKMSWFFRLAVKKKYQKQGIGSKLIEEVERILAKRGVKEVGLYVKANREDLQEFYKKKGYTTFKNPYYYMWKAIK
jgi:ribosomal protein S18 acetylase RimI-like enzyme